MGYALRPGGIVAYHQYEELSSIDLARSFGIDLLWRGFNQDGIIGYEATKRGVPSIIVEVGQEGRLSSKAVGVAVRGLKNVMKSVNMLSGELEALPSRLTVVELVYQRPTPGGFWRSRAKVGDEVKKGEALGEVLDLLGEKLETVLASVDGVVFVRRTLPKVDCGEFVCIIGTGAEELTA